MAQAKKNSGDLSALNLELRVFLYNKRSGSAIRAERSPRLPRLIPYNHQSTRGEPSMPAWEQRGTFENTQDHHSNEATCVIFTAPSSPLSNPIIKSLALYVLPNRKIGFVVNAPNAYVSAFLQAALLRHCRCKEMNSCMFYIDLSEFNSRAFNRLLNALASSITNYATPQTLPHDALIEEFGHARRLVRARRTYIPFLIEHLAALFQASHANQIPTRRTDTSIQLRGSTIANPQQSHFSNPTHTPDPGKNAKRLEALSFDESNIPEDYCCELSTQIMTDPVFDPKQPQYKFERAWIEASLRKKEENPFTRTPLKKSELQADLALKEKIEAFMTNVESQQRQNVAGPSCST